MSHHIAGQHIVVILKRHRRRRLVPGVRGRANPRRVGQVTVMVIGSVRVV
jgi:hypothetical protein